MVGTIEVRSKENLLKLMKKQALLLYSVGIIHYNYILYINGEKRGSKPKFTNVSCPNPDCKFYGISGKGNIIGNGTYQIKNKRVRKYICHECGRVFNDRTNTFFDNVRKEESVVILALKMAIKGMSIQSIADVLEVQPATINNWLFRYAKQCEKVNEDLMKNLNISKVELDELWVIVEKKLQQEQKAKMKEPGCG